MYYDKIIYKKNFWNFLELFLLPLVTILKNHEICYFFDGNNIF